MRSLTLAVLVACCAGCLSSPQPDAGNSTDAGSSADAGTDAGLPDAGFADAGHDAGEVDAGSCPPACTSCLGSTLCQLDCHADAGCACPAGFSCLVSVQDRAGVDVDCAAGTDCSIQCGLGSCRDVTCGHGSCEIDCGFSCRNVDCAGSTSCTLHCSQDSCEGRIACSGDACNVTCGPLANACTFTTEPMTCDAGLCELSCGPFSCANRDIVCAGASCHVTLPQPCVSTTVDCSAAGSCFVEGDAGTCGITCPARCDGGCGLLDDGGLACGP
ncbi:MAG: hypothetical protein U0228_35220 [Myxococcaceae bacterium]